MKKIFTFSLAVMMAISLLLFAGCGVSSGEEETTTNQNSVSIDSENPVAMMDVKDFGKIYIELYPEKAPETVENFISLVNKGFYDGLTFHRVYSGFMIHGGCPNGDGTGDPGYEIKGEFSSNGFTQNDLKHTRGVISMARSNDPDSAGSQFFIMHADAEHLDGDYAAFGKVIEGMDIVDAIASVETDYNARGEKSVPVEDVIINSIVMMSADEATTN